MISAKLTQAAADFGIRQVLLPKLRYPLVATTLSEAQCQTIIQPVLQQGLPALGINRNFPRAVAHGPVQFQGLNLPNLHTEQSIAHIMTLLKYGPQRYDPTGLLLRTCGELLRLEAGVCGPLFNISPHLHICMTETWFSHCWFQCVQRGISISNDIVDFSVPREGDKTIMELFLSAGYRTTELATLNHCRMHLKVIFLSDICNGQGTAIEQQFWSGTGEATVHPYSWPRSHKPGTNEWRLWQCALTRSLQLGRAQHLPLPLGKWKPHTDTANGWFTNDDGTQLYQRINHGWRTFTPIPLR